MENSKTFYEILGVKPKCQLTEIKTAYRCIIKKLHPDRNGDTNTVKLVNKAYEVLSNPETRSEYDQSLKIFSKKMKNEFETLRDESKKFYQEIEEKSPEELERLKKIAEKTFEQEVLKKHPIIKSSGQNLSAHEFEKQHAKLMITREQDEIENAPQKKEELNNLNGKDFIQEFNKLFNDANVNRGNIIKYDGNINPFGALDNQVTLDENGGEMNIEPIVQHNPTSISNKPITQEELERLLKERENETEKLHNIPHDEYDEDNIIGLDGTTEKTPENIL